MTLQRPPESCAPLALEPLTPYPGSGVPWSCTCATCGRTVKPSYGNVRVGHAGCRFCSRCAVDADEVVAAMRRHGWEPLEAYKSSQHPGRVRCQRCGVETTKRWNDVVSRTPGCAHCARRAIADADAERVMIAAGLQPLGPYPGGSKIPWASLCLRCGETVAPKFNTVRVEGAGCRPCSHRKTAATLRLPENEAVAAVRARGFTPLAPYPGRHKAWLMRHDECGRRSTPTYGSVVGSGTGCRHCAVSGFKPDLPADLYLITNERLGCHKIGVAGHHSDRVASWAQRGWDVYATRAFAVGAEAYNAERAVLAWWRTTLLLPPYLASGDDGWTETVSAEVSLVETWDIATAIARQVDEQVPSEVGADGWGARVDLAPSGDHTGRACSTREHGSEAGTP